MKSVIHLNVAMAFCLAVCGVALANNDHNHGHSDSRSTSSLPAWRLTDAKQNAVSSEQFSGRPYVLVLHLGQGCLHCAKQLHAFGSQVDQFRAAGVEVVGVSTDDPGQLATQLENYGESFSLKHLASDHKLGLFRGVGAIDSKDHPLHATILVDAAGRVRWSNIGAHPFMEVDQLVVESRLVSVGATTTQEDEDPDRPKIFLDKSARVIAYQLKRLNNNRLLKVSRKTDDKKYVPVWSAILTREGMDLQYRKEALAALMKLNDKTATQELIVALEGMKSESEEKRGSRQLANMLLKLDSEELKAAADLLIKSTASENEILSQASFAALIDAGQGDKATKAASIDSSRTIAWLRSIGMIRNNDARDGLREKIVSKIEDANDQVRRAAVLALKHISTNRKETFSLLASKMSDRKIRNAINETMLTIPAEDRDPDLAESIVKRLLKRAEATKPKNRTRPNAMLSMELADELISKMDDDKAANFRKRMREVSVRVVRIKTIKEEMRYDVPYFAAEAGRPIQIVLDNEDLMPHNLIVCKPGKLKKVAADGLLAGPNNGRQGKQYVPRTRDFLAATDMVQANELERLTFDVPTKPGEYPYVCTFPQHWSRMYGVMVVVDDLAAWEKNPVKPEDPIGNQRQLVKHWTMGDFENELTQDLSERSLDSGKRIFTEATCAQCHKLGDFGGAGANVGPALDDIYKRWKSDRGEVLSQILDPSSHIDPKYKMYIIATDDGLTRTGLIVNQDDNQVELLESGSISKTTIIPRDDIDEMAEAQTSIMPKALLDNFTKEEVLDLMHYLESNQK